MKRGIKKLLIANRGEIASRIIRTCRKLGIKTVAVYSDIDSQAVHVRDADQSYSLGAPKSTESYLNQDKIIEIAKIAEVDAIHPGYGFLSENASFAQRVSDEKIIFVGPSPDSMRMMGQKLSARKLAHSLGIPTVPGSIEPIKNEVEGSEFASRIGFPVILKASGGGGGKGMRLVNSPHEFSDSFQRAKSEAASTFGDDRVYIEKYLINPHHVEIQIIADSHGNAIHLGERDCSIQRRHQKVIEESPSTSITSNIRKQMVEASLQLVRKSHYVNAGTIEFILDAEKKYYFLEMNTRLQVEHPVTELRTGIDIVKEQLKIASGDTLQYSQDDITFRGHAIECRIYAEDPLNAFIPSTGQIVHLRPPAGSGIREDSGIEEGSTVSPFYDPLLSKLLVWGHDRKEAISRMKSALEKYELFGVRNNIALCRWILNHDIFLKGAQCTTFLDTEFQSKFLTKVPKELTEIAMIASLYSSLSGIQSIPRSEHLSMKKGWMSRDRMNNW